MKTKNLIAVAAALALSTLAGTPAHAAGLSVTTTNVAQDLANLLAGGGGVTITSATLVGAGTQQGTFTGGIDAGIGIESGVILTTGNANLAPGPNSEGGSTGQTGTGSDGDLLDLLPDPGPGEPPKEINDANILTFTFTTQTGELFFQYVFASEEYNEFVGSEFNDVFGFFLDGKNLALIPGTTTPVAINNVNCGETGTDTGINCGFFNNNDSASGANFNIEYDGFTDVFTARATGLLADTEYTIKLAIGDAGDDILDSAVFLKAGSFTGTDPDDDDNNVPEPGTLAMLGLGLMGLAALRRRRHGTR